MVLGRQEYGDDASRGREDINEQAKAAGPTIEAVQSCFDRERVYVREGATIDDTKCKTNLYIKNKIEAMIQSI